MAGGAVKKDGKRKGDFLAGKYLLDDLLGVGGMGEVYRATNVSLGRTVAIKLLSSELVGIEDDVNRFLREARAAAAVRHPNVVDILDVAREDNGTPFIVQELLSGEDLEHYLKGRGGTISPDETLEIMIPVADAVAAAHAQAVVHRDLKPANIFLARERNKITPKVLDFGAALYQTMGERSAKEARLLIGTPHYMAPEQIISKSEVDARSDVWALGIIMFEMMVGETPFEAETAGAVLAKVKTTPVPKLRARVKNASPVLEAIVAKCTDRDRMKRYPDAAAVRDALEAVRRQLRGVPQSTHAHTMEEADLPPPAPAKRAPPAAPSAPRIPSLDRSGLKPKHIASLDNLEIPLPAEPGPIASPMRPRLLTLSSPDEEQPLPLPRTNIDSLDIPLPMETPPLPPASAQHPISREISDIRPRLDPSGVRSTNPFDDDPAAALDIALSSPSPGSARSQPSSLPPALFGFGPSPASAPMPASAPIPREARQREELESSRSMRRPDFDLPPPNAREELESSRSMRRPDIDLHQPVAVAVPVVARPVGPQPVRAADFSRRSLPEHDWGAVDTVKLGVLVAVPALLVFIGAGLLPVLSQPVRHALLGDSMIASGVTTIVALVLAGALCARAALRERTRLAWVTAGAAILFGIAMIILTFGASDAEAGESVSTLSMATVIGPLTPLLLALAALTSARDAWKDPYSKSEARRGAALASLFLFLTLAVSPFGAVRAPPRPMKAIQAMMNKDATAKP